MKSLLKVAPKTVTNRLLAMKFAGEFILIYPLYVIMFGDRGGLSAGQISFIVASGFVLSVALEIPTGVIADKWPRKYVLMSALISKIAALSAWLLFPGFVGYFVGASLFALCAALESGALQAYLYGTLGTEHQKSFGKFWARVSAMVVLSYTIAYVCTAFIGVRYPLLITLSALACGVALMLCLSLPKDTIIRPIEGNTRVVRAAFRHILQTQALLRLLLGVLVIVAVSEVTIEYLPLYANQAGVETRAVPLLLAAGNIVGAALFWTLHSWEKRLEKYLISWALLVLGLFIASWQFGIAGIAVGIIIFSRFMRVLQVHSESKIQHLSSDEARATISSIASFGSKLLAAGIVALIGATARGSKIIMPYRTALVAGTAVFILVLLLRSRRRSQNDYAK